MRNCVDLTIAVPEWTPELLSDFGRANGKHITLIPRSPEAQDWVALHVPAEWRRPDGSVEVEPSHMTSVLMSLAFDRLTIDEA